MQGPGLQETRSFLETTQWCFRVKLCVRAQARGSVCRNSHPAAQRAQGPGRCQGESAKTSCFSEFLCMGLLVRTRGAQPCVGHRLARRSAAPGVQAQPHISFASSEATAAETWGAGSKEALTLKYTLLLLLLSHPTPRTVSKTDAPLPISHRGRQGRSGTPRTVHQRATLLHLLLATCQTWLWKVGLPLVFEPRLTFQTGSNHSLSEEKPA